MVSRRSFLTGAAFLITVPLLSTVGAAGAAQPLQDQSPKDGSTPPQKDPFAPSEDKQSPYEKIYTDAEGNQYRLCPQCGGNMYKEGKFWTCEVCGYTYTE